MKRKLCGDERNKTRFKAGLTLHANAFQHMMRQLLIDLCRGLDSVDSLD